MKFSIAVIAFTASATVAFSAPKYATEAEFTSAVVGKTIASTDKKGQSFTAMFKAGGAGEFQRPGRPLAKFKWTYAKEIVCWDFGDFKECNKVQVVSPTAVKFYDAKTGKLNNDYTVK